MSKEKFNILSIVIFFAVMIISSLVYILYDFLNNDVREVTSLYGSVQLAFAIFSIGIIIANIKLRKQYLLCGLYFIFGLLLFMQTVPAFLWFWYNGQIVNDKPYDGITGSWVIGAYHLFIIIWGWINIIQYKMSQVNTHAV